MASDPKKWGKVQVSKDEIIVASGGVVTVESGGSIVLKTGASLLPNGGSLPVVAQMTDNGGGATADGTIGVITAANAITDNGGGTNATDTIAVLVDAGGTAAGAPTTGSVADALKCLSTHINTDRTALIAAKDAIKEVSTKLNSLIAALQASNIVSAT